MRNLPLKKIFICTAIIAVCIGIIFRLTKPTEAPTKEPQAGPSIPRHISYSFALKNTTRQINRKSGVLGLCPG